MRFYSSKKIAGGALMVAMTVALSQPMFAEELNIEQPSAGATLAIENYIASTGNESDLTSFLPKESATVEKSETKKQTTTKSSTKEDEYFKDIAIANVQGGDDDYVNVRKKPNTDSKVLGKIYNNCGAQILEKTDDGWYKIKSGNCTGYTKAEYFVTGTKAKEHALDDGYVFANIKDTGIHVRKSATKDSGIVTNVYNQEVYAIKKFSKDGEWVKVKVGPGVSGWISSEFVKVSIDMDTAVTIKEEQERIRREKEEEERQRQAMLEAQNNNSSDSDDSSSDNDSSYTPSQSNNNDDNDTPPRSNTQATSKTTYNDAPSSGGGSAVVAYAKQFLGNPYVWGGSSLTNGTDCSGFTMSVYAHFGYSLNRSSYTQVYNGRAVSMSALQPGDLLFYKYGGSTISHVAIYIGGGQIIHASTEETGIIISGMGSPCAARRIIN